MKKLILLVLLTAFMVTPGFDCDDDTLRSQVSTLEQTVEAERQHSKNADHARRQAVAESLTYRREVQAERVRRGWSDTYAVASCGACLLALLVATTVMYYRKRKDTQ